MSGESDVTDYKALYEASINSAAEMQERLEQQTAVLKMLGDCNVHAFWGSLGDASWTVRKTPDGWQLQTTGKPFGALIEKFETQRAAVSAIHKMYRYFIAVQ